MHVSDVHLDQVRKQGFTVVPGFLGADELAAAQAALWLHYPRPDAYFADPGAHAWLNAHAFAGLKLFPFKAWPLNRLAYHPDLVDAAQRLLASTDLDLYKVELWGKYSGAADYEQTHHFDYGNHSLVVPNVDRAFMQMTTFILLADVTLADGPTRVVPLQHTTDVPFTPRDQTPGAFADAEVAITGPAGTLLIYHTGVLHRGSGFTAAGRSRFALLADYQVRGHPWAGKMSWPGRALHDGWHEVLVNATPRERELFGFPPPGHSYWTDATIVGVEARWPGIDLSTYRR